MKNPALRPLIKDALIIAILGGLAGILVANDGNGFGVGGYIFFWLAITGIPFGWRWAKKMFVAVTFNGFLIKVLWASLLGCVAIFVVVIGDIINFVKSLKTPME